MAQKGIELILTRQLASYLVLPIFLVDPDGTLLYYNEPAEAILGRRFDETGEMPVDDWSRAFAPTDDDGLPLPPEALPLVVAMAENRPAHRPFNIRGMDGVVRRLEVTAFPLIGQANTKVGAVAIFWETDSA
jgi:PAS domain-containing protein